ncbi:MAG: 6-phosphofructokinase [Bacillota bacterium]
MSKRLAILTGGGDCPGLNAVIRAVGKTAFESGCRLFGFLDGFSGLVEGRYRELDPLNVSGLVHRGGTILGTNNRDNPFQYPITTDKGLEYRDCSSEAVSVFRSLELDVLICVGGDGTLGIARRLGLPVIGVPKTIDNDLSATDRTFGFDTAVATATDALDRLHTTAESHHRVMVLEVMGRYAGWIALYAGIAGGSDVILIPEIAWSYEAVVEKLKARHQLRNFSTVVVAEGALTPDGERVVRERIPGSGDPIRLGGIGHVVGRHIEELTGIETRVTVLGHVQRGGSPTPYDRILATRFGVAAGRLAIAGQHDVMVSLRGETVVAVPLAQAVAAMRAVDTSGELVATARAIGISFGDRP